MDLLRESRYIISSFIIIIVCWLGWLCGLVFGEVGAAFTSAVNFPDVGLTCLANLAVFFEVILRGKQFYETDIKHPWFHIRNVDERKNVITTCEENLQKCSVVMLSFRYPATSGERKFMNIISNVSDVHSIFLRCGRLQDGGAFHGYFRKCNCTEKQDGRCGCITFGAVEEITLMLARRMPGTMKRLADSQWLLPSLCCLRNGCHHCNQGLLHVEDNKLREVNSPVESPAAVCEILESIDKVSACICIPLLSADDDKWTKELIRIFEPENREFRGVVFRKGGTNASSALENYKNRKGECDADETYSLASFAIVPHLAKALIMFVLTFLLKVDGFSSMMLANRSVSSYFSSESRQIFPHEYLTRARVKSNANNTNVCQVFFFRPAFQIFMPDFLWLSSFCTCFFGWMVLATMEGGDHTWYHFPSVAPSEGRTIVIMGAISIALAMDVFDLKLYLQIRRRSGFRRSSPRRKSGFRRSFDGENIYLFSSLISSQLVYMFLCIILLSYYREGRIIISREVELLERTSISKEEALERILILTGEFEVTKACLKWAYILLQVVVMGKYSASRAILANCQAALSQDSLSQDSLEGHGKPMWWYRTCGHYIGASAFLLNATLVGVRAQWKFS